ncbi:MAG TPA: phosphatase PAP2-related protein [Candidatus Paceibacterota bacterium]|nr:phosphatase PAP2-related protein [Candidatus Paceibacterota bacterium]
MTGSFAAWRKEFSASFRDKKFVMLFLGAIGLLLFSLVINYFAGTYATEKASNPVTDIVLDNIPVYDVDDVFVYGGYALVACIILVCLEKPRRIPFAVKSIALFYLIRSVFVSLTHIAPFPTHTHIDPGGLIRFFDFDGELFFSGHTGLPFLMALLYWDSKWIRTSFICLSIILATVVLMGHLHYSIDVFSAFFITYAIYGLSEQIFRKDKRMGRAETLLP